MTLTCIQYFVENIQFIQKTIKTDLQRSSEVSARFRRYKQSQTERLSAAGKFTCTSPLDEAFFSSVRTLFLFPAGLLVCIVKRVFAWVAQINLETQ